MQPSSPKHMECRCIGIIIDVVGPELSFIAMADAALQFSGPVIRASCSVFVEQMPYGREVATLASNERSGYPV